MLKLSSIFTIRKRTELICLFILPYLLHIDNKIWKGLLPKNKTSFYRQGKRKGLVHKKKNLRKRKIASAMHQKQSSQMKAKTKGGK